MKKYSYLFSVHVQIFIFTMSKSNTLKQLHFNMQWVLLAKTGYLPLYKVYAGHVCAELLFEISIFLYDSDSFPNTEKNVRRNKREKYVQWNIHRQLNKSSLEAFVWTNKWHIVKAAETSTLAYRSLKRYGLNIECTSIYYVCFIELVRRASHFQQILFDRLVTVLNFSNF